MIPVTSLRTDKFVLNLKIPSCSFISIALLCSYHVLFSLSYVSPWVRTDRVAQNTTVKCPECLILFPVALPFLYIDFHGVTNDSLQVLTELWKIKNTAKSSKETSAVSLCFHPAPLFLLIMIMYICMESLPAFIMFNFSYFQLPFTFFL